MKNSNIFFLFSRPQDYSIPARSVSNLQLHGGIIQRRLECMRGKHTLLIKSCQWGSTFRKHDMLSVCEFMNVSQGAKIKALSFFITLQ